MLSGVLLTLVGVGLLATFIDTSSDDSDSDSDDNAERADTEPTGPDDEASGEDVLGIALTLNQEPTLVGTEGDDTLVPDPDGDSGFATEEVLLLGGDDLAEINAASNVTIDGGAGNDTLTSSNVSNTLIGGPGDDVLSGQAATDIFGGEGDDVISVDLAAELNSTDSYADGGSGDDVIEVVSEVGYDNMSVFSSVIATGGTGEDVFDVTLQLDFSPVDPATIEDPVESASGVRITDFDPAEDSLQVTILTDQELDSSELSVDTSFEEDVSGNTVLVLRLEQGDRPEVTTRINLGPQTNIELSDINLIPNS